MLRHRSDWDAFSIGDPQRRSMTRRRVLLGATAIAANALVAACGGGSGATETPKAAASPTTAPTAVPTTAPPAATATLVPPTVALTVAPPVAPTIAPTTSPTAAATAAPTAAIALPTVGSSLAPTTTAPTLPLIVFAGAGATNGAGVAPLQTYPAQTIALLAPAKYDAVNVSVTMLDNTVVKMNEAALQTIDPLFAASRSKNIVVLFDFHDDVIGSTNAEEIFARVVTFCQARRKVGFKVVIGTLTAGDAPPPAQGQNYETVRQGVNTLIRKNLATFADALADVGADPKLGAPGEGGSRTYFQRTGFRLTSEGAGIVAGIVKAAILTL